MLVLDAPFPSNSSTACSGVNQNVPTSQAEIRVVQAEQAASRQPPALGKPVSVPPPPRLQRRIVRCQQALRAKSFRACPSATLNSFTVRAFFERWSFFARITRGFLGVDRACEAPNRSSTRVPIKPKRAELFHNFERLISI
jgi:hypothetical protein